MKILFITDLYPIEAGETTTPVTLHNFVKEWIKQGHEVKVIKPNFLFNSFLRGKPFYKTGFYEFDGVQIFNVNYFTPFLFNVARKLLKYGIRENGKLSLRGGSEVADEAIQKENSSLLTSHSSLLSSHYDVIIAHMPSGVMFANKITSNKGLGVNVPLVCGVHASDIEVLTNPIYGIYFKKQLENAYKKAKKIACRSFVLQKKFNELMPDCVHKTFVASSGVNAGIIAKCKVQRAKCEREMGNREGEIENNTPFTDYRLPFTVLTCANLIKRKNIDKLILAVNDLDGFELKIIGDGKELKNLQNLTPRPLRQILFLANLRALDGRVSACPIERAGVRGKIQFLGRLPHEKVLEEMQKADIFILPSVNESFGMVYLEAMAVGCVTVCTKNDGIDGIIKDEENGFLCEPTVEGIKETLLRIKTHENLEKILENSFETVKQYTPENCAKIYLKNIIE